MASEGEENAIRNGPLKKRMLVDFRAGGAGMNHTTTSMSNNTWSNDEQHFQSSAGSSLASTCGSSSNGDGEEREYLSSDSDGETGGSRKRSRSSVEDKLEKSRERNRLHARKTRERKKACISQLQQHCGQLEVEQARLKELVDERKVANLLLCLGGAPGEAEEEINIDNLSDDEAEEDEDDLVPLELPSSNLTSSMTTHMKELLRRERNRLHAKRTRMRKKLAFNDLQKKIRLLEKGNSRLRSSLDLEPEQRKIESVGGAAKGETLLPSVAPAPTGWAMPQREISSATAKGETLLTSSAPEPTGWAMPPQRDIEPKPLVQRWTTQQFVPPYYPSLQTQYAQQEFKPHDYTHQQDGGGMIMSFHQFNGMQQCR